MKISDYTVQGKNGQVYKYKRAKIRVPDLDKNGKEIKKYMTFSGKTNKEVKDKYADYLLTFEKRKAAFSTDRKAELGNRHLGDYILWYVDNLFIPDESVKAATKTRYINSFINLFVPEKTKKKNKGNHDSGYYLKLFEKHPILSMSVNQVTGDDLVNVFASSTIAPSSKEAALKLLRNFYKYCAAQHISSDITTEIKIPKPKKKRLDQSIPTFNEHELCAFRDLIPTDHRLRLMVVIAMYTGMRISEICALKYCDINLKEKQIYVNKSLAEITPLRIDGKYAKAYTEIVTTKSIDSVRSVPIGDEEIQAFHDHKKWHKAEMVSNGYRTDYLFTTKTGELYFKSTLRTALKRICLSIGVEPQGWHTFRHTYASRLANNGRSIEEVCELLGHSDISVTSKYYVNVSNERKRAARESFNLPARKIV